jgi:hypothetical protein
MKLTLTLDNKLFGIEKYYPDRCTAAELILKLMGRKSFTDLQVKLMKAYGWEIVIGDSHD